MARWISICKENGEGPFKICFTEEGVPDEDYLRPGEVVNGEYEFEIDFDQFNCPFMLGTVYVEDD